MDRGGNSEDYSRELALAVLKHFYGEDNVFWRDEQQSEEVGDATYDIVVDSKHEIAIEVTAVTSSSRLQIEKETEKNRLVERVVCSHDWVVFVLPESRFKMLLQEADQLLGVLEKFDLRTFRADQDPGSIAYEHGNSGDLLLATQRLAYLGVDVANVQSFKRHGIMFQESGFETSARPLSTVKAVQAAISKPDNLKKLRAANTNLRNMFVVVESPAETAWGGMEEEPPRALDLPDGIQRVWVATHLPWCPGVPVWVYDDENGWRTHTLTEGSLVKVSPFRPRRNDG